jgi:hypothetical protein
MVEADRKRWIGPIMGALGLLDNPGGGRNLLQLCALLFIRLEYIFDKLIFYQYASQPSDQEFMACPAT